MKFFNRLYSIYGVVVFFGVFLLLLPLFFVYIQREAWHSRGVYLNRLWTRLFLFFMGLKVEIHGLEKIKDHKQVIFASNHFSYFDIPSLSMMPFPTVFIGKSSLAKIPIFGYMYSKLHITIDRNSMRSRYETFQRARVVIDRGDSLCVFPEGGISKKAPALSNFKEGPFRLAIEKNIPLVPITLPDNYRILPDDGKFLIRRIKSRLIIHDPIDISKYSLDTINELKSEVFDIIENELRENIGEAYDQAKVHA